VKASLLTGEFQDMKVSERVEQGTGTLVEAPKLRATLKLKNTSVAPARARTGSDQEADRRVSHVSETGLTVVARAPWHPPTGIRGSGGGQRGEARRPLQQTVAAAA
jgi:hypothetical protein